VSPVISTYAGPEEIAAADVAGARTRDAMLAYEVTSADGPASATRKPDTVQPGSRTTGVADDARHRLFAEVALGIGRARTMLKHLGPQLPQTGLLTALESKAPDTYDHARRVAESATALAKAMCLPASEVREVRCAALFHDIGKIAMPSHMLDRSGPLSEDERSVLQLHVSIGAELLSEIPSLAAAAPVVMATQERYDGSGYPWGLAGSDIPLGARIIAVADAYDAMTARCPYGTPLSRTEALKELVRCAGAAFDPEVVQAWLEMVGVPAYWSE
jgi:putative nucleotidyltransferase with HDIG domain